MKDIRFDPRQIAAVLNPEERMRGRNDRDKVVGMEMGRELREPNRGLKRSYLFS